jgi:transcriptional antiterminator RfaH
MYQSNADLPWYAVHARPQQELLAAAVIQTRLDLPTWLPEVKQQQRGQRQLCPLFPGYLFVQASEDGLPLSAINRMPGVVRVVAFGPEPQPLPGAVIADLRAQIGEVNARGGLPQHPFKPGATVRFRGGPLEGMEALFVGPTEPAARVEVLLRFLGSQRTLHVAPGELEAEANPIATRPQPRRSRGVGRPIRSKDEVGRK